MKIGKFEVKWSFSLIATYLMTLMVLSGLFMLYYYVPTEEGAFQSIENMVKNVSGGKLARHIHMVGSSFMFLAYYFHMFRGLYLRRYQGQGRLFWLLDIAIFYLLMVVGFSGYTLPLSQMSGWGLTVISQMYQSIPLIGETISRAMLGGDTIGTASLQRMLIVHCTIPFVITGAVCMQVWAKRIIAAKSAGGVEYKGRHASHYYGLTLFLTMFIFFVLFFPYIFTAAEHLKVFNRFETPVNIMPEWYFLPYYAQLGAFASDLYLPFGNFMLISAQNQGLLAFFASIAIWFFVPWLDRGNFSGTSKSYKIATMLLAIDVIILGLCATKPALAPAMVLVRLATVYYFAHFLIILPLLSKFKK